MENKKITTWQIVTYAIALVLTLCLIVLILLEIFNGAPEKADSIASFLLFGMWLLVGLANLKQSKIVYFYFAFAAVHIVKGILYLFV